uniref:Uncharacterized protein n=1 Tax=Alexandrium catenella TaxID=2925 RepID=A0A7S1WPD3_ALECA|mmetsp:Transcript_78966/g.209691  ORF Transcript_78966/g.209691 Transcript_78966/m.209691 type:complete len:216 (+) Transcript_78966:99-746(+)|eukprot:CAMPEP_0171164742 /NCGR_PEP_ID=MMETSP0790-20130122/5826_1 /TAXON_ID=2925 /ORGANISM="Alexandrium catenella, Strain OF101" /LENGTH=215 /DNA_ID=CAMNT_0011629509 /DNA_START=93 /DNA_END=740 /DNA_ORIENTATION=+
MATADPGNYELGECEYRVVQDYLLKKASPDAEKIAKVKRAKGSTFSSTGGLFVGKAGGKWAQEKLEDASKGAWFLVGGPGFNLKEPLLQHSTMEFSELGLPPANPMRLWVANPSKEGEKLVDLPIKSNWTVGQVKDLFCTLTGLKKGSTVMMLAASGQQKEDVAESQQGKGRMGSEDSNLKEESGIVTAGFADGDEIGFIYMGVLETDLQAFLAR